MAKSKDAFRTISEVADWLETQPHVLRFWESKFSQVRPVKRAGGRRYYRPADMQLLGGIKTLLHDDGMTIKGVQKLLREKGIKEISALSRPLDDELVEEAEAVEIVETAVEEKHMLPEDIFEDVAKAEEESIAEKEQAQMTEAMDAPAPKAEPEPAQEPETVEAAVEAVVAETVEEPAVAVETSTEDGEEDAAPAQVARPTKPMAESASAWEIRRKIFARLTEIDEIPTENRAELAAVLKRLETLRQNAGGAASA